MAMINNGMPMAQANTVQVMWSKCVGPRMIAFFMRVKRIGRANVLVKGFDCVSNDGLKAAKV